MKVKLSIVLYLLVISPLLLAKMSKEDITSAYRLSYQYEKTQNYIDAIKALQIVAYNYPKTYTVNLRLGYLFLNSLKYANSTSHYKIATTAIPTSISAKLGLMSIAIAKMNYEEAETIGFKILKIDIFNYYANLKISYSLMMQNKYDSSHKIVSKMLALYPEDILFLQQLGQIYAKQKIDSAAQEVFSNLLILDPENVQAKMFFGQQHELKKK